ncbi:retrovirus-related pol polyprotein from transposon TNT 1-94 [Tanacetum coccineum]|uniref:Retrovirus-related pol polyprotein from transposon TNT 1-94 n=1 Tax=Tanacetum coccineum TaxID=301880 RepID=A0ABQ4WD24_9ASTR
MTGDRSRLRNFMKKFIGTVRFGNDHFGAIMGYGDYVIGDSVISRVYYVEGLGHNLFSVGQFCDSDLEVAFRKHTCFVRDLDGVDLIKGSRAPRTSPGYGISPESLNFGTLNDLDHKDLVRAYLGCERLKRDHLCSACHHDLKCYYEKSGITTRDRSENPQQNGVVERRNRTLVEAARTMLIFSKAPLFLWAEAVASAVILLKTALCYPTNDSEDLGKLKAKANIGFFVGYAPNIEGLQNLQQRTRQSCVRLVPNPPPAAPYVPPTTPINHAGPSVFIPIDQEAPSRSHSPSSSNHQSSSVHQGVAAEHSFEVNPFATDDPEPFVNVFAPDHKLYSSSYGLREELHSFSLGCSCYRCFVVKLDEYGDVLKNKARLVAKGYRQEEGLDFKESFALASLTMIVPSCLPSEESSLRVKAGCQDTQRSTSGSAQFLGDKLVSWSSKKQTSTSISSTEAEYIAMSGCCAQILWMREQVEKVTMDDANINAPEVPTAAASPPTRSDEQILPCNKCVQWKKQLLLRCGKSSSQFHIQDSCGHLEEHQLLQSFHRFLHYSIHLHPAVLVYQQQIDKDK